MDNNRALVSSGYLDYTWKPVHNTLDRWLVRNATCKTKGAGITMFHIKASGEVHNSIFLYNSCELSANSISIENVDGYMLIDKCFFLGPRDKEVSSKFGNETDLLIENCEFDQNLKIISKSWNELTNKFEAPKIPNK